VQELRSSGTLRVDEDGQSTTYQQHTHRIPPSINERRREKREQGVGGDSRARSKQSQEHRRILIVAVYGCVPGEAKPRRRHDRINEDDTDFIMNSVVGIGR